jgi:tol-pal system-associated acyl-CoA thioesterase
MRLLTSVSLEDFMKKHEMVFTIYLEDTDAQGIVYHANYLHFFERARTEILRELGIDTRKQGSGEQRFVVHQVSIKYLKPALLDDRITIESSYRRESDFRLSFHQQVIRSGTPSPLVLAEIQIVCVNGHGELIELPKIFDD